MTTPDISTTPQITVQAESIVRASYPPINGASLTLIVIFYPTQESRERLAGADLTQPFNLTLIDGRGEYEETEVTPAITVVSVHDFTRTNTISLVTQLYDWTMKDTP